MKAGPVIVAGHPSRGIGTAIAFLLAVGVACAITVVWVGALIIGAALKLAWRASAAYVTSRRPPTYTHGLATDPVDLILQALPGAEERADRVALLRSLAARERDAGNQDAATLVEWLAVTEEGGCPVRPDSSAYPVLARMSAATDLGERGRACLDLHTAMAPQMGDGAAILRVLARVYFRLAGYDEAAAAQMAGG